MSVSHFCLKSLVLLLFMIYNVYKWKSDHFIYRNSKIFLKRLKMVSCRMLITWYSIPNDGLLWDTRDTQGNFIILDVLLSKNVVQYNKSIEHDVWSNITTIKINSFTYIYTLLHLIANFNCDQNAKIYNIFRNLG